MCAGCPRLNPGTKPFAPPFLPLPPSSLPLPPSSPLPTPSSPHLSPPTPLPAPPHPVPLSSGSPILLPELPTRPSFSTLDAPPPFGVSPLMGNTSHISYLISQMPRNGISAITSSPQVRVPSAARTPPSTPQSLNLSTPQSLNPVTLQPLLCRPDPLICILDDPSSRGVATSARHCQLQTSPSSFPRRLGKGNGRRDRDAHRHSSTLT
jgi:hypothetical protein